MKNKKYLIIIAAVLIISIVSVLLLTNINKENVKAYDYREGFLIAPESEFSYGVAVDSSFKITTKEEYTLEQINKIFFIQDFTDFNIEKINSKEFRVTLNKKLNYDSVYVLGIKQTDLVVATFVYQTVSKFSILGYLPNKQSTDVPINTGIEVYFSNSDITNFKESFSISPNVKGRFEVHDNAYVFVPLATLKYKTVYTVSIEGGLIKNSDGQTIEETTTFSFETTTKTSENVNYKYKGYINFEKLMYEYPSNNVVSIPYYMNMPEDKMSVQLDIDVFKFSDGQQMIEYIDNILKRPYWSMYNSDSNNIDTSKLKNILSFQNMIKYSYETNKFILDIPEQLERGMYLVKLNWEHGQSYVVIQVTDLSAYVLDDESNTYVWVHNLIIKESANAKVNGVSTDNNGLAIVSNEDIKDNVIKISNDTNETYVFKNPYYYNSYNNYWSVLTTDRNLYKPTDKISFFGFVAPRDGNLNDNKVIVEINRGYYYYFFDFARPTNYCIPPYPMNELPLVSYETTLNNGFYEGNIALPALAEGYYTLTIKYKGKQISNKYFNVEEYKKPTMKISITPDKKAVFADERVQFTVNTSFFEGTPVSNLDISYFIDYEGKHIEKTVKSDKNGNVIFSYTPVYINDLQGQRFVSVGVRAKLPEVGELVANTYINVYMNDIEYTYKTDIKNNKIKLEGNVYNFIPDYKTGQKTNVGPYTFKDIHYELYKNTIVKKETGTYYDYINKKTVTQYRYDTVKTLIQKDVIKSDSKGNFSTLLPYHDYDRTWYTIELVVNDKNNRAVSKRVYVSKEYDYEYYNNNNYRVELDKEKYSINDLVKVAFKKGEEDVLGNQFMFVISRKGIQKVIITDKNTTDFTFIEDYMPNATIQVIAFNGKSYQASYQQQVLFNKEDRKLNVKITTDKKEYKPGEIATITIKVTDKDGKSVNSKVLISAVDEALLTLSDMHIDFLNELYQYVDSGIKSTYGTHKDGMNIFYSGDVYGRGARDDFALGSSMEKSLTAVPSVETNGAVDKATIRSDFKDTATFISINTDENGIGVGTFKMPDNITSWRLFANALNNDFYAGGNYINVNTTLPFFINVVTNNMFLVNDKAYIGVTGYGDALSQNDNIDYKVYMKNHPDNVTYASTKAFKRINIQLPAFDIGNDKIIVEAYSNKYGDAIATKIFVTDSYNKMQVTNKYNVENNMNIKGGTYGNTTLVFADMEYIDYVTRAYNLAYYSNERLELLLARDKSIEILSNYLTDSTWISKEKQGDVDYKKYQQSDGGLAILPYGQSDLKITVDNLQFLKDDIDQSMVLEYLYQNLSDKGSSPLVLYGLSQFKQPILLELTRTNSILNLTTEQLVYLALAYYNIGDTYMANSIYENRIKPKITSVDPYSFVNEKNEDYSIYLTVKIAYLAKLLNQQEATSLFKYSVENYTKEYVINNYIALYLEKQLENKKENSNSFTYTYMGKTKDVNFKNNKLFTYEIPSQNLSQFVVSNVVGNIGLLVTYEDKYDIKQINDNNVISVDRKYYDTVTNQLKTSFNMGDIIKVELTINKGKNFLNTIYEITDILPSGLKAIEKPYQYLGDHYEYTYMRASNQVAKATFSKYFINHDNKIIYYARVINTGTYEAMGTYVKLLKSNKIIYQAKNSIIKIGE